MITVFKRLTGVIGGALFFFSAVCSVTTSHAASVASKRPPLDSFLNQRVDSVDELVAQVNSNSRVREHYAKVFNIPGSSVVSYFRKNLVESYVSSPKSYSVWCVSKNGRYYRVNQTLHAGIRVLALRDGTPVLKWACGNPLTSVLPSAVTVRHSVAKRPDVPAEMVMGYTSTIANEGADAPLTYSVVSTPVENSYSTSSFMVAGATELLASPSVGGASPLSFLPLGLLGRNSYSSSSLKFTSHNTPATPEPASYLALLLGVSGIAVLVIKKRQSNGIIA
jgi:hypothetical protein